MPGLSSAGCATRTSVECLSRREHPGIPVHHRHVDCSRRCSSAGASAPADGQQPRGGRIRVGDNTQGSDATHNRARSARRIFNVRRADCANDDAIIDSQRALTAAGRISATAEFDAAHRRRFAHCNRAARGRRTFDLRSTNGKRRARWARALSTSSYSAGAGAGFGAGVGAGATPSFFCRLVEDVVYWNTRRLSG